jgi:DNA-binding MarR family transcriptional regulator
MVKAGPSGGAGFLIAQIGAHAAAKFADRLEPLGFAPHHAGILRLMARRPGLSQQELAAALRMHASRLVGILDDLQQLRLIERRASSQDRRLYALHLTPEGEQSLAAIGNAAREHSRDLLASLSEEERATLTILLERIAVQQGLSPGVHPGYAGLRKKNP